MLGPREAGPVATILTASSIAQSVRRVDLVHSLLQHVFVPDGHVLMTPSRKATRTQQVQLGKQMSVLGLHHSCSSSSTSEVCEPDHHHDPRQHVVGLPAPQHLPPLPQDCLASSVVVRPPPCECRTPYTLGKGVPTTHNNGGGSTRFSPHCKTYSNRKRDQIAL
jgi:hypothetical protein